jgi:hypothetical protein
VLAVGVTSFQEREQVPSLLGGGGGFEWILVVVAWLSSFNSVLFPSIALSLAPPFIASKGRARVTFVVKW